MSDRSSWSHDINLDDQPVSASQARAFVRHHLVEHHLANLSDDVELVVSELATNAMRHARTAFTVSLGAFDQTLLLEVEDGSAVWPTRVAAAHALDTHGRGLTLLDLLCRDWGMYALPNCGKAVWAEFSLPSNASLGRREPPERRHSVTKDAGGCSPRTASTERCPRGAEELGGGPRAGADSRRRGVARSQRSRGQMIHAVFNPESNRVLSRIAPGSRWSNLGIVQRHHPTARRRTGAAER